MTARLLPLALLASALWLWAALHLLPVAQWPAWPLDPARMDIPQILLGFGLMPRGIVALLAGAALGLSGAMLQVVLRNPVADPTTLGISAGASTGAPWAGSRRRGQRFLYSGWLAKVAFTPTG